MTFEYWQIVVMLSVFAGGMRALYEIGYQNGKEKGLIHGIDLTLIKLKQEGIIDYDEQTEIASSLQDNDNVV